MKRKREGRNEFHHLILERSRVADGCRRGMSWPRESVAISILTSRTWSAPSPVWKENLSLFLLFHLFSLRLFLFSYFIIFFFLMITNNSTINYWNMWKNVQSFYRYIILYYPIRRSFIIWLYSFEYRCFSLLFAMTIKFESHSYSQHPYWEILYGIVSREVCILLAMIENFYWT